MRLAYAGCIPERGTAMLDKLSRLIDVKSIVTIGVVAAFIALALTGAIDSKDFMSVVFVIITFYFAKKDTPAAP